MIYTKNNFFFFKKIFYNKIICLYNYNHSFYSNKITLVLGKNGSGKSILLLILVPNIKNQFLNCIYIFIFYLKESYFFFFKFINNFFLNYYVKTLSFGYRTKFNFVVNFCNIYLKKKFLLGLDEFFVYLDKTYIYFFFKKIVNINENINFTKLEINHLYYYNNMTNILYIL